MIGLYNIQEHAGEYWRNAATQAYTGIIEHDLHAYDGMVCLGSKGYEEYFKEIMTTWAVLASRGPTGKG